MFETVLMPTDGSKPAEGAVETGAELAAEHGATVHALYAVEPMPLGKFTAGPEPASAEHGEILDEQKSEAKQALERVTELCADHGVDVVDTIEYGKPSEEILDYVDTEGMDAVVMGTHGRSGAERLVMGSVAEKVVRKSPVPVLTIRPDD
ncbi:UspA domain protein [Natronomonas pharaonis DSM 2160]|uniref:UspA domain protein n=1 Tax=Natronomonas pharaonis (strain ATCC 35678 / DSM 2160 / CIP 103997 / JCM 8858 / NBRC 14720 / NCIMB 2260 / Gabara) TaxID=348780 RepID=A0A1U7EVF8_NATPD|nr:universal stress protein [Natronomonas pharaonis]CAI49004.1 UspA domain protein [Natronomonas pharaonis DSM 2160]